MLDFLFKILTSSIAIYGAVVSTYLLSKNSSRIKLRFHTGFIPDEANKLMIPYCAIEVVNLSYKPIYIKTSGFMGERKDLLNIPKLDDALTEGSISAIVDSNAGGIIKTGERMRLIAKNGIIDQFEGVYIFYSLKELLSSLENNKKIYYYFTDYRKTHKKRLNIKRIEFLKKHLLRH